MSEVLSFDLHGAPISKILGIYVFLSYKLAEFSFQKDPKFQIPDSLDTRSFLNIFQSKLGFSNFFESIVAFFIVYQFRIFERRYGSLKFSSQLLGSFLLSSVLEVLFRLLLRSDGYLSNGPLGLLVPGFVAYFYEVPALIGRKVVVYLCGLFLMVVSLSNTIAFACALIAGILYRYNILWVQSFLKVPQIIGSFLFKYAWIVDSEPPNKGLMGATIEIQRALQIERSDQLLREQIHHGFGSFRPQYQQYS